MPQRSQAARAKGRSTATRDDVVAAGARALDRTGIDALSMRAVAAELGVAVSALYWHVRDKRELLSLIVEASLRELRTPEVGAWDARLAELLRASRRALRARPALVPAIWAAGWALGPETQRIANALTGLVAESGMPQREVRDAYFALVSLLLGFVQSESNSPTTQAMDRRFDYAIDAFIRGMRTRATASEAQRD
jgi:TetR/AcrR family transcriptional regulator, tetracycline repressor protein